MWKRKREDSRKWAMTSPRTRIIVKLFAFHNDYYYRSYSRLQAQQNLQRISLIRHGVCLVLVSVSIRLSMSSHLVIKIGIKKIITKFWEGFVRKNMVKNLIVVELSKGLNGTYVKSNPDNGMLYAPMQLIV